MRKNVLILAQNYLTQFVDIFNQYTRVFDPEEYEVTVVYLTGAPKPEIQQRTLAENVIFLNFSRKNIRSLKIAAIKKLLALSREKQFQIVICHRYKSTYIMMCVAKFYKIPVFIAVLHELSTMSHWQRKLFIAGFAPKNSLFAGVSNAVRDDIRKSLWWLPKERIITLYNMIDVDLSEPQLLTREAARAELQLNAEDFVFGTLGRLAKQKDQKSLIQAFANLKPHYPNAKLIIAGIGDLEVQLKQQAARLGLEKEIIFTGFLPNGFRYLKAFDCFILSSIQEAFGRVLLEAMIAKLPIIATSAHGIPEVMGEVGTLLRPGDIESLTKSMHEHYLLSAETRADLGQKNYQHAVANFSIPKFHEEFWKLDVLNT